MRVRITFAKQGSLRYIGHLDLHKIWERSIRRAKLPLSYSQGYHPQPKIHLAAALPLGFSSRAEVMDMWLNEEVENVASTLQAHVPPGLTITSASQVDDREPSLQSQVIGAEYQVEITETGSGTGLTEKVASVLEADSIPRVRRKKPYDLRPLIEELTASDDDQIFMRLTAREGATGRPEEVLDELGIPLEDCRIERTALFFEEK
jgi:radical SAM-linked protein